MTAGELAMGQPGEIGETARRQVRIEFYGIPRERAGRDAIEVEGSTLGEALEHAARALPRFGEVLGLHFDRDGKRLRLWDPQTRRWLLTSRELSQQKDSIIEQKDAEIERLRRQLEQLRGGPSATG